MILSAELSPVQGGVGGGDVLGEEGDGQGQVSEGGETLSQSSEQTAQSSQSESNRKGNSSSTYSEMKNFEFKIYTYYNF